MIRQELFGNLKTDTIRRNSQRSIKWLVNKIKTAKVKKTVTPKIGGLYLYCYDPKYKDKLPYYDNNPLVILLSKTDNGFYGLNVHYLKPQERVLLLNLLHTLYRSKSKYTIRITLDKLKALGNFWKFALKRYLYDHLVTKLVPIEVAEWKDMIMLPVASFEKETQRTVLQRKK